MRVGVGVGGCECERVWVNTRVQHYSRYQLLANLYSCACVCLCACVHVCMRACVSVCMCVCVGVGGCGWVRLWNGCVGVRVRCYSS